MIGLLQRVSAAQVTIAGEVVGAIGPGLLVLVGIQRGDDERRAERLLERLLGYRVFPDATGRMNLSLREMGGGLLLVPQFTLAADTRKGTAPASRPPPRPRRGNACSIGSWSRRARHTPRSRWGALGPTCG